MNTLAGRFGAFGSTFSLRSNLLDFALTLFFLALALARGVE